MKRLFMVVALMVTVLSTQAQTAREEIAVNPCLSGSNHLDYDRLFGKSTLSPAPKGYEPFYLTHYGRHGSRWLIGKDEYSRVVDKLKKAQQQGKLTAKGQEVLQALERFVPTTIKRLGDLTTVGERQHHGIGKRMAQNFPEIFRKKGVTVDARSTVVPRCILSMVAECEELMAANPSMRIHNDVSESLQYYLNQPWSDRLKKTSRRAKKTAEEYQDKLTHPERIMKLLFTDTQWAQDSIRPASFMRHLFNVANNMQSHDTDIELLSLFTTDELYDLWRMKNVGWYLDYGAAPQTEGIMPFSQANLLRNIIETADTVRQVQATLRFGHEVCVLPLACLLELDDCGASVSDLDQLDQVWRNYRIFPMACNVQLVFYRPKAGKEGDVLVKALLNEREARMPVRAVEGCYYRWSDLRKYYTDKLSKFEQQ